MSSIIIWFEKCSIRTSNIDLKCKDSNDTKINYHNYFIFEHACITKKILSCISDPASIAWNRRLFGGGFYSRKCGIYHSKLMHKYCTALAVYIYSLIVTLCITGKCLFMQQ